MNGYSAGGHDGCIGRGGGGWHAEPGDGGDGHGGSQSTSDRWPTGAASRVLSYGSGAGCGGSESPGGDSVGNEEASGGSTISGHSTDGGSEAVGGVSGSVRGAGSSDDDSRDHRGHERESEAHGPSTCGWPGRVGRTRSYYRS